MNSFFNNDLGTNHDDNSDYYNVQYENYYGGNSSGTEDISASRRPEHRPPFVPPGRPYREYDDRRPEVRPPMRPHEYYPYERPEKRPEAQPPRKPDIRPDRRPPERPGRRPDTRPAGRPPVFTPERELGKGLRAVDPSSIRACAGRFTYIWTTSGQGFWMYPTNIGRHSISGYRWTYFGWVYSGLDLRHIESFFCMP